MQPGTHRRRSPARARSASSATASRPTTSRPPARSRRPRPPENSSSRTASQPQDFNSYGSRRGNDRDHDARHVRQRPHQEPDGAAASKAASRVHQPDGETDGHLRRRDASTRRAGTPLVDLRRPGIRHRQLARLGGERHEPARRERRSSRRASSASTAATSSAWACCRCHSRKAPRAQTLKLDGTETYDLVGLDANIKPQQDLTLHDHARTAARKNVAGPLPHRYAHRDRLLPARRHPAVCAAAVGGEGVSEDAQARTSTSTPKWSLGKTPSLGSFITTRADSTTPRPVGSGGPTST